MSEPRQVELARDAYLASLRKRAVGSVVDDELDPVETLGEFLADVARYALHVALVVIGEADRHRAAKASVPLERMEDVLDEIAYRELLRQLGLRGGCGRGELLLIYGIGLHSLPEAVMGDGRIAAHAEVVVKLLGVGAELRYAVEALAVAAKIRSSTIKSLLHHAFLTCISAHARH